MYYCLMDLLSGLNEAQKRAVLHKDGPLLILAGAGAGKTRAISHRVAYLASQGVALERILAITFTNKAAEEMKERINNLLVASGYSLTVTPFISTFHSLGVYIMRESGRLMAIPKNFSILDKEDSLSLIKGAIKDLGMDPKQFQPPKIQAIISRYKGDMITNEEFSDFIGNEFFHRKLSLIWNKYEELLQKQKSLDFDDLILKPVLLLQKDRISREHYQDLWRFILIDEYQDTNKAQYELSKILADKHRNICVIGDMDQSIYGWRGADFRNIINFENDFPGYNTIVFEENYRSTQIILEAAARVIEKNKMRKPKNLRATKDKGVEISLFEAMNEKEEAEFVIHKIKELLSGKDRPFQKDGPFSPSEVAVLFRANFQSRIFEETCLRRGIPYQMLGTQFYKRKEIKDIFAFIRASLNPESSLDIKRIINIPKKRKLEDFLNLLASIKEKIENSKPSEAIKFIMQKTGYQEFLENGSEDDRERFENIKELVSIAVRYDEYDPSEGIEKLLSDVALMAEQDSLDKKKNAVRLMTAHSAKGLEFENVFVVGMEEGLFPHAGLGDRTDEKEEEERRLFYVAMTRAKEKLFLSFSVSRMVFGGRQLNLPSKFLSDIPEHLMKLEKYGKKEEFIEYD